MTARNIRRNVVFALLVIIYAWLVAGAWTSEGGVKWAVTLLLVRAFMETAPKYRPLTRNERIAEEFLHRIAPR